MSNFVEKWESVTDDEWVLTTIREGLQLDFKIIPKNTGIKHTHVNAQNQSIFTEEISKLIQKEAIEIVPYANSQIGFYSTLFLVRKKTGDLRPVINLKPLNKCIVKKHFKMDTLAKTLNLIKVEDWAISLDLKDEFYAP